MRLLSIELDAFPEAHGDRNNTVLLDDDTCSRCMHAHDPIDDQHRDKAEQAPYPCYDELEMWGGPFFLSLGFRLQRERMCVREPLPTKQD